MVTGMCESVIWLLVFLSFWIEYWQVVGGWLLWARRVFGWVVRWKEDRRWAAALRAAELQDLEFAGGAAYCRCVRQ